MVETIEKLESQNNIKILYLSLCGSYLFGTNDQFSDKDYKGLFISSKEDIILKKDLDFINQSTNSGNKKNSSNDIDFHLDSLHTWLALLKKGETGAIDLLFSIWDESSTIYIDTDFKSIIQENYLKLISKNPQSFVGYCISQSKKYNVKGERYNELVKLQNFFHQNFQDLSAKIKESSINGALKEHIQSERYKYIDFVIADGPRASGVVTHLEYLEILGKKFAPTVSMDYLVDKINDMEESYGSRARAAVDNIDWKGLSHAIRVIFEVEELVSQSFITFPLKQKEYIYAIKQGKIDIEEVIDLLDSKIKSIDTLMKTTTLLNSQDETFVKELLLKYYG